MNWKAEATDKLRQYSAMRLAVINLPAEITVLENGSVWKPRAFAPPERTAM